MYYCIIFHLCDVGLLLVVFYNLVLYQTLLRMYTLSFFILCGFFVYSFLDNGLLLFALPLIGFALHWLRWKTRHQFKYFIPRSLEICHDQKFTDKGFYLWKRLFFRWGLLWFDCNSLHFSPQFLLPSSWSSKWDCIRIHSILLSSLFTIFSVNFSCLSCLSLSKSIFWCWDDGSLLYKRKIKITRLGL